MYKYESMTCRLKEQYRIIIKLNIKNHFVDLATVVEMLKENSTLNWWDVDLDLKLYPCIFSAYMRKTIAIKRRNL